MFNSNFKNKIIDVELLNDMMVYFYLGQTEAR